MGRDASKCLKMVSHTLMQLLRHFYIAKIFISTLMYQQFLFWHLCAPWGKYPLQSCLPHGNPELSKSLSLLMRAPLAPNSLFCWLSSFYELFMHPSPAIPVTYDQHQGLPLWLSSKESARQFRRREFDPWVGKIPWRRKMATHSSMLAWDNPMGQRSLAGYSP